MDIALHIPVWVLWVLGIPVALVVLWLAYFGLMLMINFKPYR